MLLGYVGIPIYVFNVVMWGQGIISLPQHFLVNVVALKRLMNYLLLPLYKNYKKHYPKFQMEDVDIEEIRIDHVPSNILLVLFIIIFILFFILEVTFFVLHQELALHDSLYMSFAMVTSVSKLSLIHFIIFLL